VSVLASGLRKELEDACVRGRRSSEQACRAALGALGVAAKTVPAHLSEPDRALRRGLRAKSRQLGDDGDLIVLLVSECAYEQWHRLLFARFLAENGLLIHPRYRAPVTLAECDELAAGFDEPDGWAVAGRFAAEILPGIFRIDDPCVQLRLAPEGRLELEKIVSDLPAQIFTADDSLGWVYQFWQKEKKDEVNASERKIGGADLGPVTQLFTENYMVRFLLENSLGAWWASRRPNSPLVKEWEFLQFDDQGAPAAGSFDGWPDRVGDVTVMDPCCGSGHFLVEAFGMLWRMRAEQEGLAPISAQDTVLRDNLFGLELDPRCVQIAMFAVALTAWKAGGGWRELPVPNVACSGIPIKAPVEEWTALASGDPQLENALVRLHILFRDADTLGSLIDPKRAIELTESTGLQTSFEDVQWDDIAPLLIKALTTEGDDPATAVLGADAAGIARAADYLSRQYTLVATNVPYLSRGKQTDSLRSYIDRTAPVTKGDLAVSVYERSLRLLAPHGAVSVVMPDKLLYLPAYRVFRESCLLSRQFDLLALLGPQAFRTPLFDLGTILLVTSNEHPDTDHSFVVIDVGDEQGPEQKLNALSAAERIPTRISQRAQLSNPDQRILISALDRHPPLSDRAQSRYGLRSGDSNRFIRTFWEVCSLEPQWRFHQGTPSGSKPYSGRETILRWSDDGGLHEYADLGIASLQGGEAWGRAGVVVKLTGDLQCAIYSGESFDNNVAVVWPDNPADLDAIWSFLSTPSFNSAVRQIDQSLKVMNATLLKVPFDFEYWQAAAQEVGPLPEPSTDDPTQWLFKGRPEESSEVLQVAVARLLGYRWPEQPAQSESDDLDDLADNDGIVCLPSVSGERPAADRLEELLARSFRGTWSPARTQELLATSGSRKKDLESWLRDDFFKAHCQVFKNRPFIWQIWDGCKDGFSALVNYHRLDRANLERLTYTCLGDWIERQSAALVDDATGAEDRLAAAQDLQRRLQLILDGEGPYDIYVRWKSMAEQPIGWDPDLNDGVRLNVRPFVEAGVLRTKFNVKWDKDRGKNPDGSERHNHLHYSLADKTASRKRQTP
jgi:hypothetical protein